MVRPMINLPHYWGKWSHLTNIFEGHFERQVFIPYQLLNIVNLIPRAQSLKTGSSYPASSPYTLCNLAFLFVSSHVVNLRHFIFTCSSF